jgi:hypothetical protein
MSLMETIRSTDARKKMAEEFALSLNSSTILPESERKIPGLAEYCRPEKYDELRKEIVRNSVDRIMRVCTDCRGGAGRDQAGGQAWKSN